MVDAPSHPNARPGSQADSQSQSLGLRIETSFRRAVTQAIQQAHEAGLPVSYLDESGRIVWLATDGKTYPTREAAQTRHQD